MTILLLSLMLLFVYLVLALKNVFHQRALFSSVKARAIAFYYRLS